MHFMIHFTFTEVAVNIMGIGGSKRGLGTRPRSNFFDFNAILANVLYPPMSLLQQKS